MVPIFSCYPSGTVLLRAKKIKIKISLPLEIKSLFRLFSIKNVPKVAENLFRPGILGWSADCP